MLFYRDRLQLRDKVMDILSVAIRTYDGGSFLNIVCNGVQTYL